MKALLDDFTLHTETEKGLLSALDDFTIICKRYNFFLSATKCKFFTPEIKWCGRIIIEHGYRPDPRNASELRALTQPITSDELWEFINCCFWQSAGIPAFSERVAPPNGVLEEAYTKSGLRTKRSIKRFQLRDISWGPAHIDAFKNLKECLSNSVHVVHPKPNLILCIHTIASERFWLAMVSQRQRKTNWECQNWNKPMRHSQF